MLTPVKVVAAIIEDAGEILACRRAPNKSAAGQWEFPGGKVEQFETQEQALIREIKEELNIEIKILRHFDTSTTTVGDNQIELSCFVCELISQRPESSTDHDQLSWLTEQQLSKLDWAKPDLPAVKKLTIPFC